MHVRTWHALYPCNGPPRAIMFWAAGVLQDILRRWCFHIQSTEDSSSEGWSAWWWTKTGLPPKAGCFFTPGISIPKTSIIYPQPDPILPIIHSVWSWCNFWAVYIYILLYRSIHWLDLKNVSLRSQNSASSSWRVAKWVNGRCFLRVFWEIAHILY